MLRLKFGPETGRLTCNWASYELVWVRNRALTMTTTRVEAEGYIVGRAAEQVDEFIAREVEPIRERYRHLLGQSAEVQV